MPRFKSGTKHENETPLSAWAVSADDKGKTKFQTQGVIVESSPTKSSSQLQHPARRAAASKSSYAPSSARATHRYTQLSLLMEKVGLSKFTNTLIAEGFTAELILEALRSKQDEKWLRENLFELNFTESEISVLCAHTTSIYREGSQDEQVTSKQANVSTPKVYYAQENETLNRIASKFGLDVNELIQSNQSHLSAVLKKYSRLKENTEILLNGSSQSTLISRPKPRKYGGSNKGWSDCHLCGGVTTDVLKDSVLICDTCKSKAHLHCSRLSKAPLGKWRCRSCSSSWNVEKIIRRAGNFYEVKWEGYPQEYNTMEPIKNFKNNIVAQAFEQVAGKRDRNSIHGLSNMHPQKFRKFDD